MLSTSLTAFIAQFKAWVRNHKGDLGTTKAYDLCTKGARYSQGYVCYEYERRNSGYKCSLHLQTIGNKLNPLCPSKDDTDAMCHYRCTCGNQVLVPPKLLLEL